ncbi:Qat anti-phage system associated protein QatB [Cellulosimicrobium funkei]|uniref:Qat anti-phage system associated protein QatB n=1 Tax=Cellulosimicrobium funkei TaxID=264251 RepID=UPI0036A88001
MLPLEDDEAPTLPQAPTGRFQPARFNLGRFAKSGDRENMRRAVAYYVRSGYGGGRTMTRRMGGTSRTASRLGTVLQSSGQQPDLTAAHDAALAHGTNAQEVLDAIVEVVRPTDGTQDAEASRRAIRDALSDVLVRYPEADLLDLDRSQREYVQERYVALDVFNRFELDVGAHLQQNAPSTSTALARLAEIRAYVWETVAASFRKVRDAGTARGADFAAITQQALAETFYVFEGYLP